MPSIPGMERAGAHPQSATTKWAKYQEAIRQHALRAVDAREQRDREQVDRTDYHRSAEQASGG